jgi:dephospho-CoA kinase
VILKVGLTGGIASGKSTIARMFAERGCVVVDADRVVADLYRPGRAGHTAIVREYGDEVLTADGEVDRARLSAIAFRDQASSAKLNALIHPIVIAEQARLAAEAEAATDGDVIFVVEATLLIESGGRARFDRIVVVDLPPEDQVARAVTRGMSKEEARRRMAHQMERSARLAHADYVIDNRGGRAEAAREVERVLGLLRNDLGSLAAMHRPE